MLMAAIISTMTLLLNFVVQLDCCHHCRYCCAAADPDGVGFLLPMLLRCCVCHVDVIDDTNRTIHVFQQMDRNKDITLLVPLWPVGDIDNVDKLCD